MTALIVGATQVDTPFWAPGLLSVAAALNAPLIIFFLFWIQTRHRRELLGDDAYVQLAGEASRTGSRVRKLLDEANLDLASIIEGRSISDAKSAEQELRHEVAALNAMINSLSSRDTTYRLVPAEALLEAAKGLMSQGRWSESAQLLHEYHAKVGDDWQVFFSLGVAYANSRGGSATDLSALRAYNEAIALVPPSTEPNLVARLFSYRAAVEKRLDRLEEAESDLHLAKRWVTRRYEKDDILYNLACIYAMSGRRESAIELVRDLMGTQFIEAITNHLGDYFKSLRRDPDFLHLLKEDT